MYAVNMFIFSCCIIFFFTLTYDIVKANLLATEFQNKPVSARKALHFSFKIEAIVDSTLMAPRCSYIALIGNISVFLWLCGHHKGTFTQV